MLYYFLFVFMRCLLLGVVLALLAAMGCAFLQKDVLKRPRPGHHKNSLRDKFRVVFNVSPCFVLVVTP